MTLLVVDLTLPNAERAVTIATQTAAEADVFSVGPDLLLGPGLLLISALTGLSTPVIADAKLHDTPERVHAAARHLGRSGARWVTAHAAGGDAMLHAAVGGLADGGGGAPSGVLAVTVLPRLRRDDLVRVGIDRTPGKLTAHMSRAAARAGCEGVIASPDDVPVVASTAPDVLKVARLPTDAGIEEAVRASRRGADAIIVGRIVTAAADPAAAARHVADAIREAPNSA